MVTAGGAEGTARKSSSVRLVRAWVVAAADVVLRVLAGLAVVAFDDVFARPAAGFALCFAGSAFPAVRRLLGVGVLPSSVVTAPLFTMRGRIAQADVNLP